MKRKKIIRKQRLRSDAAAGKAIGNEEKKRTGIVTYRAPGVFTALNLMALYIKALAHSGEPRA